MWLGRGVVNGKRSRCSFYRRLAGLRDRCGRMRKISPPQEFNPRTAQSAASRHTDSALPAHYIYSILLKLKILLSSQICFHFALYWKRNNLQQISIFSLVSSNLTTAVNTTPYLVNSPSSGQGGLRVMDRG
jgi:hypothetical protein